MDYIKLILEIFGLTPADIPRYALFIIIFGLMVWFIFQKQFKPLKKTIKNIETFCTKLSTFLIASPKIPDGTPEFNPVLDFSSPVKLKSIAYSILKDSGAENVINNNKPFLFKEMEKLGKLRTALDVQNIAGQILIIFQDNPIFDKIKLFAYQYPRYKTKEGREFSVSFKMMIDITSIYLRDLYLENHPEIKRTYVSNGRDISIDPTRSLGDESELLTKKEEEDKTPKPEEGNG